ncbi:MAG: DUF3772 domain-containing protein [Aliishimia sp.]
MTRFGPVLSALWFVLLSVVLVPGMASAQDGEGRNQSASINYTTWESAARRAEAAVDSATDTNAVFETLRDRIVGFRSNLDLARRANTERITTLRGQIEALGDAPENSATEAPDIAKRRETLTQQLQTLLAPVQAAQEAYTRADGLIGEIDAIIRDRQTKRLLSLGPSPLNPTNWATSLEELGQAFAEIAAERRVLNDERLLAQARENLPLVLFLLVLGGLLVTRGRTWAAKMGNRLRDLGGRGTGVWSFIVSLLRIILPLAGLFALTEAIRATGLVGLRGAAILDVVPVWGLLLLGYRWLAERLFSRNDDEAILLLVPVHRSEARFYITVLAFLMLLRSALSLLFTLHDFKPASEAVLAFPIVIVLAIILFRFGHLLREYVVAALAEDDDETPCIGTGFARILTWLGLSAQIVGIVAPIMSGLGYSAAGNALLYPTITSLGILGCVMALQCFAGDLYGWITGQGSTARDSLVAVLISFGLLIFAAPLLALVWGARVADLTELWSSFLLGFQIGETRISPTDFMTFAILFTLGYILTRLVQNALRTSVLPKTKIDPGGQTALVSGVGYVGIFLAALVAITTAGIDLSSLAIVAGALSVGIGFGLQTVVSNFVSGIILLIERPISEGDWIEVGGSMGYVRNISVRSTRIETFDRSDVIVPNSDLISGTVTNYTRGNTVGRVIVPVGVAYGTDTRKVETILKEIAQKHPMVLANPAPSVVFQNFGASSLDFEIRAILRDVNWMLSVKSEMNHEIAKRFVEEGIEIPFPQQDLWLRNPEALTTSQTPKAAPPVKSDKPDGDPIL